jgi:hypothetical protein
LTTNMTKNLHELKHYYNRKNQERHTQRCVHQVQ